MTAHECHDCHHEWADDDERPIERATIIHNGRSSCACAKTRTSAP